MTGPGRRSGPAERRERRAAVDDPAIVVEAAAAFLAVRPRSVAETRRRLRHLGFRDELVEAVVTGFVALGYLDDEAFARAWIESRDRARPRGTEALRRELLLKGVDRGSIDAALGEREAPGASSGDEGEGAGPTPDEAAADRLLARKATTLGRELDPRKRRQKAYVLLARHGFSPDVIGAALGRLETLEGPPEDA
ncbi:MAG: regulatory protein RecX [Candidatus Limnocylindrales bacterium]